MYKKTPRVLHKLQEISIFALQNYKSTKILLACAKIRKSSQKLAFFQEICRKQGYLQHFGRHWQCEIALSSRSRISVTSQTRAFVRCPQLRMMSSTGS